MKHTSNTPVLVLTPYRAHRVYMHATLCMILLGSAGWAAPSWAGDAFGIWKVNRLRSGDPYPTNVTVRFEPHAKGEVFTIERIDGDGLTTTSSTILYLDGKPRDLDDPKCRGTQSSRRVDSRTVEILHKCSSGESTLFVRRLAVHTKELMLDITEQNPDGRRFERRLVLEKQ